MTMPAWSKVEELFHAALERAPAERAAFLARACGGDEGLRREIESLLAEEGAAERLMEQSAAGAVTQRLAVTRGTRLGPYEVTGLVGAGGMGEVYRARDTRLGRDVAVKVLPNDLARDPERLRRFEAEARAVASLSHPRILTVHDVGTHEGTPYVVTELLEGETLREVLARRAPALNQALSLAIQAAQGLAAAHRKGVVHRDVKPENLFVTSDGQVKILDFGLAKCLPALAEGEPRPPLSEATRDGVVLGTVAYMSPEQAQGLAVDVRSDVFSFGVVLYELLTGTHPFRRDTPASTLGAILENEPKAPGEITRGLPHDLEKIVVRCLRKDPARRFQHMDDVELELAEVSSELETGGVRRRAASAPRGRRWMAGAAALLALAGASAWLWLRRAPDTLPPPTLVQLTSYAGREVIPALSPDGRQVAFVWNGEKRDNYDVYVQLIGGGTPLRLTSDPAEDGWPAWSADGRQLAFRRRRQDGDALYVVSALGGPERKVADLDAGRAMLPSLSWTPDGRWLVTSETGVDGRETLVRVSVDRGEKRPLRAAAEDAETAPALSPDGRQLAYAACTARWTCEVFVLPLGEDVVPTGPPQRLTEQVSTIQGIAWVPDGRTVVYAVATAGGGDRYLWRVAVSGTARPERIDLAGRGAAFPTAPRVGARLAFSRGSLDYDIWKIENARPPEVFIASTLTDGYPQFSPDGTRVAFCSNRTTRASTGGEVVEIFVADADGSNPVQLTDGPGVSQCTPQWSPDGSRIAFDSEAADGRCDVLVVDATGGPPRLLETSTADERVPAWSRDGRWLYFASNRSGRFETWRVPAGGGEAVRVTWAGGFRASESADGRTLYYVKAMTEAGQALHGRAVGGGEERRLFDGVRFVTFFVTEAGVHYLAARADGRPGGELRFFDLATGKSWTIASIDTPLFWGMTVSPDRKTILFTARKPPDDDLLLIENFR